MCESCLNYFDLTFSLSLLFFFIFFILYEHTLALLYYIFKLFDKNQATHENCCGAAPV